MFYPGNAPQLDAEVAELLDGVENFEPRLGYPKALIVPHAGYIYSGPVAARAYDELPPRAGIVKRVVLHRAVAPRRGPRPGAARTRTAFETPLGRVPMDAEAVATLADLQQVVRARRRTRTSTRSRCSCRSCRRCSASFRWCRSPSATAITEEVAQVIDRLWGGPETLFVISSDLSHYHSYDEAQAHRRRDARARSQALAVDLNHEEACGATPTQRPARGRRAARDFRSPSCSTSQFGRHRRRQGPRGGLFGVRRVRGTRRRRRADAGRTLLEIAREARSPTASA